MITKKRKAGLKIAYNNLFETHIKNKILDLKSHPRHCKYNYLMIMFGKILNKLYLSDDYKTEKYNWKELYNKIIDKLNLTKD